MLLTLLAVFAIGNSTDAHSGHPQKKLFSGRWYKASADLTASPPWFGVAFPDAGYPCDLGYDTASCLSKWQGPASAAYADWNSQPTTARFNVQGNRDHLHDNNIYIVDSIPGASAGLLGFAAFYDYAGTQCSPHPYPGEYYCSVYRWSDALIIDDNHTGVFGTAQSRQATITHELGHVLSLRHESVNADESVRYECGQDNTGTTPLSVMSYDCVNPPGFPYYGAGIYTVQDWDTCGVNHAYPDATYGFEECVCYAPATGPAQPPGNPAYYHPVTPARILDTRSSEPAPGPKGKVGENCVISVQVAGVGGVPASGVSAVVLNATVTQPSSGSFLTLYPSGASLPLASNLNFAGGQTVPNLVTVKVGPDGKVNVYNAKGSTHVVLDVAGWYDSTPASSLLQGGASLDAIVMSHDGSAETMAIDMNTSGNSANTVGTIETCARIIENDVQDADETAVDALTLDVTIQGIPPYDAGTPSQGDETGGIIGFGYELHYDTTQMTVVAQDANFKVGAPLLDVSDFVPDDNADDYWTGSAINTDPGIPPAGDGVIQRITIRSDIGASSGQNVLQLINNVHLDASGSGYLPHNTLLANIAINQACGLPLVTPTPSPTATPPPTPSPSPSPGVGFGYYHPVAPARILDTRTGPGPVGKIGPGQTITVDVTNPASVPSGGGVPATGVSAVVLNTTVTEPTASSYLTVFPSLTTMPVASNLNFPAGATIPNLVIVKVGTDGNVRIFNAAGSTHVIFDVAGWFGGAGSDGTLFRSQTPARILDTRSGPQGNPSGPVDPGETITVDVTNVSGSSVPANASAVILNVTATGPTDSSFLTVFPSGAAQPLASNLNFGANQTVPNLVIVKVGADGYVKVYNKQGSVHVIFDVAGWYSP